MENHQHLHEDGRDQDDLGTEVEPTPLPALPDSDPEILSTAAAALEYRIRTVNFARIQPGQQDEAVPNCEVTIGALSAGTNSFGNASMDLSDLPNGEHTLTARAPQTSSEPVGPDLLPAGGVDYVWREARGRIKKEGAAVSVVSGQVDVIGGTIRIALDPVWMRSNASSARGNTKVDLIVIHHTGSNNVRSDVGALVYSGNVSAHYLIPPSGKTIKLVPENRRAWHAGYAFWQGAENINARSIGIEITNSERDYETEQISAVVELVESLIQRIETIPKVRVIAHSDTAITHPDNRPPTRHGRKSGDPSSAFPWEELEAKGWGFIPAQGELPASAYGGYFGLRPDGRLRIGDNDSSQTYGGGEHLPAVSGAVAELQRDLARIGYYLGTIDGVYGQITHWALRVFEQHIFSGSRRTDPLNSGNGKLDRDSAEMVKRVLGEAENFSS